MKKTNTSNSHRIRILTAMGYYRGKHKEPSFSNPEKEIENDSWFTPTGMWIRRLPDLDQNLLSAAREKLLVTDELRRLYSAHLFLVLGYQPGTICKNQSVHKIIWETLSALLTAHAEALCAALKI